MKPDQVPPHTSSNTYHGLGGTRRERTVLALWDSLRPFLLDSLGLLTLAVMWLFFYLMLD